MIFWLFTSLSRDYETVITIPVNYKNIPFTRNFNGELPKDLEFHFKGSGFDLFTTHIRKRPDSINIDISRFIDKSQKFSVSTISLRNQFPGELKAYRVTPEVIAPDLINRSSKRVPVVLLANIDFKNRFGPAGKTIVRPDSIDLAGPDSLLDKVSAVYTDHIVLKDIATNHFAGIKLNNQLPKGVVASQPYVYYYVTVQEYSEGNFNVPIDLPVSQRSRITLLPKTVKVSFLAPLKEFNSLRPSDFKVVTEVPFPQMPQRLELRLEKYPSKLRKVRLEPELADYLIHE